MNVSAKDLKAESIDLCIVYAEDEDELRQSVTSILKRFFNNVHSVDNGQKAFEVVKKENVDIVLTDLNMPIMGGMELIQSIGKIEKNPKLIVMTAFNDTRTLEKLINLQVDHFTSKPLNKEQLITLLYKSAVSVNERKLLGQFEQDLNNENNELRRKNDMLTQKLKQLAATNNQVVELEAKRNNTKPVETVQSYDDFYDSLLADDVDELHELLFDLDSKIISMFNANDEISLKNDTELSQLFKRFAVVLNSYQEFYDVAVLVLELSYALENPSIEIDMKEISLLLESLLFTMKTFNNNVFDNKIQNPRFYNASLLADITLVHNLLTNKENENLIEFF